MSKGERSKSHSKRLEHYNEYRTYQKITTLKISSITKSLAVGGFDWVLILLGDTTLVEIREVACGAHE